MRFLAPADGVPSVDSARANLTKVRGHTPDIRLQAFPFDISIKEHFLLCNAAQIGPTCTSHRLGELRQTDVQARVQLSVASKL